MIHDTAMVQIAIQIRYLLAHELDTAALIFERQSLHVSRDESCTCRQCKTVLSFDEVQHDSSSMTMQRPRPVAEQVPVPQRTTGECYRNQSDRPIPT